MEDKWKNLNSNPPSLRASNLIPFLINHSNPRKKQLPTLRVCYFGRILVRMENLGEKSEKKEVLVGVWLGGWVENFVVRPCVFYPSPPNGEGSSWKWVDKKNPPIGLCLLPFSFLWFFLCLLLSIMCWLLLFFSSILVFFFFRKQFWVNFLCYFYFILMKCQTIHNLK